MPINDMTSLWVTDSVYKSKRSLILHSYICYTMDIIMNHLLHTYFIRKKPTVNALMGTKRRSPECGDLQPSTHIIASTANYWRTTATNES